MKYFFTALIAALSTVFVSCSDDNTITTMPEFQLSTSYVSLPVDSGSVVVDVTATESWSVVSKPDWVILDKMSGTAGQSSITFTAKKTLDGRTGEVLIALENGKIQRINVIQGLATISEATVAEVMAGPDSKTYQVKGTVTKITETVKYGNFYLNDGTSDTDLYIYGTKYNGQTQQAALEKLGVEVGDEIIVSGPKTTYNGTVELVDVDVIKLNKSLIKVDSIAGAVLPIEGGVVEVFLANKGNGVYVDVPEDAKDWLSIASVQGNKIVFNAAANPGGDRSTTVIFKTTDGKKDYTAECIINQKGAIVACSIADFNAAAVGSTVYRLTGIISSVASAEKGRFYIYDYSGSTYVYNYADFAGLNAKAGDIVTVVGKRDQYKETIEMTGGEVEIHTSVAEVTISEFLTKADDKDTYYMVSGVIDEIANATYGNIYIKDENGTRLYVYGCYPGFGATGDARKNVVADKGLKIGDKLTVIGVKSTYKDVPQVNGGFYFSHVPAN